MVSMAAVAWGVWGRKAVGVAAGVVVAVAAAVVALGRVWTALRGRSGPAVSAVVLAPEVVLAAAGMADEIAVAVRRQWEAEVQLRRVDDPYTIPVRWEAAEGFLVADWVAVERAACSAGWPTPDRSRWAAGPAGLAGCGDVAAVLDKVPTGRLVVLGESGAGKTTLAVRLVLDLLARRSPGGPVPVLVPLGSWDPARKDLWAWLEARLCLDHPALRDPASGGGGVSWARVLWEAGLFLPVLDGLDDIAEPARGRGLARLNETLRPGVGLVLTAGTGVYRAAVREAPGEVVSGAAGVRLCPLDAGVVADYLRASAGGPDGQARWERVLGALADTAHPVGQALTTPLMATLARTVYNPRPGEPAAGLPHPDELLGCGLGSRVAVERHLLDGFLPAAYRLCPDPALRCPWEVADARRWLTFLAGHLERRGTTDLAWWKLHTAVPRPLIGLAGGLAVGLLSGLANGLVTYGLGAGLVCWLAFGLLADDTPPAQGLARMPRLGSGPEAGLKAGLKAGLMYGLGSGFVVGLVAETERGSGSVYGLTAGLGIGLTAGLAVGFRPRPVEPAEPANPRTLLSQDRGDFRIALAFGLGSGIVGGVGLGLAVGLTVGLMFGLALGLTQTASAPFAVARCWLALRGRLPWRLMRFLTDAHEQRGVLRQDGATYQFRHAELQRHLAGRP
jgi:hypothetical protein